MTSYLEMTREELLEEKERLEAEYKKVKALGLNLNMARGKPSPEQLDLSMGMFDLIDSKTALISGGTDCRNYGDVDGIAEAKELMAGFMDCRPEQVIVFGNASLNVMFDAVAKAYTHGVLGSEPWCKLDKVKFLCPAPGYDRHFKITEHFGIEMINVPMKADGPDMDIIEKLVSEDAAVKGVWCVPKYSNPQGITYSDAVVRRFAALKPAAEDFRIYWDNAYAVHDFDGEDKDVLLPLLDECEKNGNANMVYEFCSTSKVTFAGAGISAMAASVENLDSIREQISVQTIGYDKINQWMHVQYLKDMDGVRAHMAKHAAILRPKFEVVDEILSREITPLGIGTWIKPKGGYFICFEALEGCAKVIVKKAKEAGITLTGAGAPFPYGNDPKDATIRIAPSYPSVDEMRQATEVFVCCVKLASVEKLLSE